MILELSKKNILSLIEKNKKKEKTLKESNLLEDIELIKKELQNFKSKPEYDENLDLKENLWELLSNEWSLDLTNQTKTVKIADIGNEISKILKVEQIGRIVIKHEV